MALAMGDFFATCSARLMGNIPAARSRAFAQTSWPFTSHEVEGYVVVVLHSRRNARHAEDRFTPRAEARSGEFLVRHDQRKRAAGSRRRPARSQLGAAEGARRDGDAV